MPPFVINLGLRKNYNTIWNEWSVEPETRSVTSGICVQFLSETVLRWAGICIHGVYESYITMRNHLKLLENSGFVQSHSGYIVNLNFIKSISERAVLLRDGEKVILSQKRKTSFVKAFNTYYFCWFSYMEFTIYL